jgi:hypothetical protein
MEPFTLGSIMPSVLDITANPFCKIKSAVEPALQKIVTPRFERLAGATGSGNELLRIVFRQMLRAKTTERTLAQATEGVRLCAALREASADELVAAFTVY